MKYRIPIIFLLLLLATLGSAHTKKVASDGCHRQGDTYHCHSADTSIAFVSNEAGYYAIASVTDGDTLDLTYGDGVMQVRLFGVDTPETRKGTKLTNDAKSVLKAQGITKTDAGYADALEAEKTRQLQLGETAKAYVKTTLQNKDVFFLFDDTGVFPFIAQGKYGRYLTYIFYADGETTRFLNIDLIVDGYAELDYIDAPFRYRWAFLAANLQNVQTQFGNHTLPAVVVPQSPHRHSGITTTWAALKQRSADHTPR